MWILDKSNFDIFICGNLRIKVLIVTVAVLMCYIGKILKNLLSIIEV